MALNPEDLKDIDQERMEKAFSETVALALLEPSKASVGEDVMRRDYTVMANIPLATQSYAQHELGMPHREALLLAVGANIALMTLKTYAERGAFEQLESPEAEEPSADSPPVRDALRGLESEGMVNSVDSAMDRAFRAPEEMEALTRTLLTDYRSLAVGLGRISELAHDKGLSHQQVTHITHGALILAYALKEYGENQFLEDINPPFPDDER